MSIIPPALDAQTAADMYSALHTGGTHPEVRWLYALRERVVQSSDPLEQLCQVYDSCPELYDLLWLVWCLDPVGQADRTWYADRLRIINQTIGWEASRLLVADWISCPRTLPLHTLDVVWYWTGGMTVEIRPLPDPSPSYLISPPDDVPETDGVVLERCWAFYLTTLTRSPAGRRPPADGRPSLWGWLSSVTRDPEVWERLLQSPEGALWAAWHREG